MSAGNKHMATFVLGALAALGAYKYSTMSDEEKKKMTDNLKDKFNKLKAEAEDSVDSAKDYFSDLKSKASNLLKEHFPNVEQHLEDLFKGNTKPETNTTPGS